MSAGGIFGLVFNLFVFAGLWSVCGFMVEKLAGIFNYTITVLPTLQDAANGFTVVQTIYTLVLPVIVFVGLLINYYMNEHSMSQMEA